MEEIIRGSKMLVFPLLFLFEALTFTLLLMGRQENCFFSIQYNCTGPTCAKRRSGNDSSIRAFNACMGQGETQNAEG